MGAYAGTDYFVYGVCDHGSRVIVPRPRWPIQVLRIIPIHVMKRTFKTFFLPFLKQHTVVRTLYQASDNYGSFSTVVRSVTSIKVSYPHQIIYFDHWEDGYESNIAQPVQSTSRIWGDGILSNGVAPGIQRIFCRPVPALCWMKTLHTGPVTHPEIRYDGRDKIYTTADVAISKVTGDNAHSPCKI